MLKKFLDEKHASTRTPRPIILRWLESRRMDESLKVIERLAGAIMDAPGGRAKLEEWFLSDDQTFNTITAEVYILSYLKRCNPDLGRILGGNDVDAVLTFEDREIGIEVTSLNGFVAEWIFIERLNEYLSNHSDQPLPAIEISYEYNPIQIATQGNTIYQLVEEVGRAILCNDEESLEAMKVSVTPIDTAPGIISWEVKNGNSYPWFNYVTHDLLQKLQKGQKQQQLGKRPHNVVFVAVNHMSTVNWAFPAVFEALSLQDTAYQAQVDAIRAFWLDGLQHLQNVNGICFFVYSLNQEEPFYPLEIIWRDDESVIPIEL